MPEMNLQKICELRCRALCRSLSHTLTHDLVIHSYVLFSNTLNAQYNQPPFYRRVFATCSQQEPYGVMEEEEEGDGEERVSVRGAGAKQEEEDVEERS